jgi:hypothetical protein
MGTRGVGRSVVRLGAGIAAGVALGVALERALTERELKPTLDSARNNRAHTAEAPLAAPTVVARELADSTPRVPAAMEAKRDDAKVASDEELAGLARLRERVKELEAQVARLEAIVAANDPRTKRIREIFAKNELRHGALYREIAELACGDPESVAEDPRRMCGLLIRLIDETGLLAAPFADGNRDFEPEPEAPGIELSLNSNKQSYSETIDGVESPATSEQASLSFSLILLNMPEHWLGEPFALRIHWSIDEGSNRRGSMQLEIEDPTRSPLTGMPGVVSWRLSWEPEEVHFSRTPVRGGEENLEGGPRDYAAERRLVNELFERLRVRARG